MRIVLLERACAAPPKICFVLTHGFLERIRSPTLAAPVFGGPLKCLNRTVFGSSEAKKFAGACVNNSSRTRAALHSLLSSAMAFVCVVALAAVGVHGGIVASTGSSSQFRAEDGLGNYNFGYDEAHPSGGSFRRESGNSVGVKAGSYGLRDIDGRVRVVNYVADGAGFRAAINTNEPGTAPSLPAASTYNAAPVHKVTAPVVAAASYAAPVVAAAPAAAAYSAPVAHAVTPAVAAYAAPAVAAPVAHVAAPAVATYSTPVAVAAPVAVAKSTSYSSAVNHGTVHAAPVAVAAPAVAAYANHHVAAAPTVAHYAALHGVAAPAVAHYAAAHQVAAPAVHYTGHNVIHGIAHHAKVIA
ncbi:hypothetical protein BIW11_08033 [Tropilaelaps mercedesae]|uniref:Cuticle protein 14-like n=1 Tax=Tropilaelaps mercedesae TaxID=418985 RepID=A0A1V9XRM1_9ACAR|nr:hypothetical protein BIW11_08033 [Tropilaelaps mercedesae]